MKGLPSIKGSALILSLLLVQVFISMSLAGNCSVFTKRTVDTVYKGAGTVPDTLGVTIRFYSEGRFDTLTRTDTIYDTGRVPIDVVLSLDLSTSMSWVDSLVDPLRRPRVVWAKHAALGFLDSLKPGDRVAIMGWTASGSNPPTLADTANTARYYRKWSRFTGNFDSARAFIRDSLFIDSTVRIVDTCEGVPLVVRDNIPGAVFTSTPLRISSILAARRLSEQGRSGANRAVIMLTDGENNDGVAQALPRTVIDSLHRKNGQQFHTIGFVTGDTAELRALAGAGNGAFCNAARPGDLDSVYAKLAGLLISRTIDTSFSTVPVIIKPDTVRGPVDVLLAIDLSNSMTTTDNTLRTRLAWVKMASLEFIDSLRSGDRVAILGSTSSSLYLVLADTANPSRYYRKWCPFTADFDRARDFIFDSLYSDGDYMVTDTFRNRTMMIVNPIDFGTFGDTPLRVSSVVATSLLSTYSRPDASKAVIILTDGLNNDDVPRKTATQFIDSLKRAQSLQFHTIGFIEGDTTELKALAQAGGGSYYNAKNSLELRNAYSALAREIVLHAAARDLLIQDALFTPPLYYVAGSQKVTAGSTVPADSFRTLQDGNGNTLLRWYFKVVPVWGVAEVNYKITAPSGRNYAIGVDSLHAAGGQFSSAVFGNDSLDFIRMAIPPSGKNDQVCAGNTRGEQTVSGLVFRRETVVFGVMAHEAGVLALYDLGGRKVFNAAVQPRASAQTAVFRLPASLPSGVYVLTATAGARKLQKRIAMARR